MIHSIVPYGGRDLYGVKSIKEETEYPLMSVDGVFIATAFSNSLL